MNPNVISYAINMVSSALAWASFGRPFVRFLAVRRNRKHDTSQEPFGYIARIRTRLIRFPRGGKQTAMLAADFLGLALCGIGSVWLTYGTFGATQTLVWICLAAIFVMLPVFWLQGFYRSIVRYLGAELLLVAAKSALVGAILLGAIVALTGILDAPLRWSIVFAAAVALYMVGSRTAARLFLHQRRNDREPVIVYGAGEGGARLTSALINSSDFFPVALVDDSVLKQGIHVNGVEVYPPSAIKKLITDYRVSRVLLAIPSVSRARRQKVLEHLTEYAVHVQTIPEIGDLVTGRARVDEIRDVAVADLLGRDAVPPDRALLSASVEGKTVMVTGAGGSIGSELCRQILALEPKRIVLLELAESALYEIEQTLRKLAKKREAACEVVPLLGSVHHKTRVRQIMETFEVQTVYHSAAYKHVPIVEQNLFEGIHNNVFGTLHAVQSAIETGVETFVLISTDKAVNPSSVMGATKRFAELVLQAYASTSHDTRLCMVRFGNVLESSGSVVPLFKDQIRNGGPVTVTHRDIVRYFMTIPEASQLVIQAAAMARGGDVFVLDMGEPLKILDLAHRMISLMGLTVRDESNPDGDIEISYTGLRPAEKLYEELLIGTNVSGTDHPRILRADEDFLGFEDLAKRLRELENASRMLDYSMARDVLATTVHEYLPNNGIDDLIWLRRADGEQSRSSDRVVDFPTKPV